MKLTALMSLTTAIVLAVSAPAWAQMGSSSSGSMSNGGMSSSNNMPNTCQGMMDKASSMTPPTDESKNAMATKQMDMAKTAMASGDEKTCMSHMKKAMHYMM
jgi:hypothetical protein